MGLYKAMKLILTKKQYLVTKKLTNADLESNRRMSFAFAKYFPGVHVRSEETTDVPHQSKLLQLPTTPDQWMRNRNYRRIYSLLKSRYNVTEIVVEADDITIWIDPLDATKEYTMGLYHYVTTMIGIAYKGSPIIGVIHKPFQKQSLFGLAFDNNAYKIQTFIEEDYDHSKVLKSRAADAVYVSRSFWKRLSKARQAKFSSLINRRIIPAGGAGFKSWQVVEDGSSVYIHTPRIKLWDICAPNAILKAGNKLMVQLNGLAISYNYTESALHTEGIVAGSQLEVATYVNLGRDLKSV